MRALPIILLANSDHDAAPPTIGDVRDEDLVPLLIAFYARARADRLLAPYFAPLDMTSHIPRIADFWSTVVFRSGRYRGNAVQPHRALAGLRGCHFARWIDLWESTVDAHHAGPVAERMKAAARRIADSMQPQLGVSPCAAARAI